MTNARAHARSGDIAIDVRGVSKTYHLYNRPQDRLWQMIDGRRRQHYTAFHALTDISFDVRRGETVGIVGINGSGKSTLLQIVCGTLEPSRGEVRTSGRIAALLELGSGFDPAFSGRENVYMNGALFGLTRAEVDNRFDRIAAFADIGTFIEQPVRTYSTGMVVRLAFAVIANLDADIMVIDEALAVGDAFFVQKCMRFLRGFMERGTLLFVSHDTGAVANLCQRAIWLHQGHAILDGRAADIADAYHECLAEEMLGGVGGPARAEALRVSARDRLRIRAAAATAVPIPPAVVPRADDGHIEVQTVRVDGPSFGDGGARISSVALLDSRDAPVSAIRGGETLTLIVRAHAATALDAPILGFIVKDRLGQTIFGDNTFEQCRSSTPRVAAGEDVEARFTFTVPILAPGHYAVSVAVADGTQLQHVQHHWVHDAVIFRSTTRSVATGLVGIPMQTMTIARMPAVEP